MLSQLEVLHNALLFEEVPAGELLLVEALLQSRTLRQGETLAVRGEPLPFLVLVEEGALELLFDSSPICTLSPGSIFGEDALVTEAMAQASLRAACATRVALLERSRLVAELPRLPSLRRALEEAWRRRVLAAGLYQIDLFQALSPQARALLLERFERVELEPGAVLATEGAPGDTFTFIRAGEAQLHLGGLEELGPSDSPDAQPETAPLRPGDYLGDAALLDDAPHTATVTTAAGLSAMQLSRLQFEEALSTLPGQLAEARSAYARRSEGF